MFGILLFLLCKLVLRLFLVRFCFFHLLLPFGILNKFQKLSWAVQVLFPTSMVEFLVNAEALKNWVGCHSPDGHEHTAGYPGNDRDYLGNKQISKEEILLRGRTSFRVHCFWIGSPFRSTSLQWWRRQWIIFPGGWMQRRFLLRWQRGSCFWWSRRRHLWLKHRSYDW